ncbi:hypothetical protein PF005_g10120 [Phytophthora fragariae]|uniref:RxLR effector protein n=1 Tax=Phytophthora fragariae TaxID=53985 RepID=A0A6A3KZI9_9STRA|nr:hypothetical protein PF003_g23327 [Phytophthora fragariae]KAE8938770.1 hypothetical protein PF009_g11348 [Phytophthora fragariae]KAE9012190.1 hypothetical protein PF011_g9037 [Phytophthora fragariae]KAE9114632.1 hypothetical protein PF010_g9642 [Phytophthora fragariae]KAE9114700.1 hypothetical protein PF007_g10288 [Phytophthora fragariae]
MIKRFDILLLVVVVAMLSCAHADDAPAPEVSHLEQVPHVKEPVPANKEQMEQVISGGGGFIPTGGISYRWRYTDPYLGGFH